MTPRTAVLYATTRGTTRLVAQAIAKALGPDCQLWDLRDVDQLPHWAAHRPDLLFAGGPTYGQGELHYLWQQHGDAVGPLMARAPRLHLFGLGDARFHGSTFCGAIGQLHDLAVKHGGRPRGATPADRFTFDATPALRDGSFPGLVIDFRADRQRLNEVVIRWLVNCSADAFRHPAGRGHPVTTRTRTLFSLPGKDQGAAAVATGPLAQLSVATSRQLKPEMSPLTPGSDTHSP